MAAIVGVKRLSEDWISIKLRSSQRGVRLLAGTCVTLPETSIDVTVASV